HRHLIRQQSIGGDLSRQVNDLIPAASLYDQAGLRSRLLGSRTIRRIGRRRSYGGGGPCPSVPSAPDARKFLHSPFYGDVRTHVSLLGPDHLAAASRLLDGAGLLQHRTAAPAAAGDDLAVQVGASLACAAGGLPDARLVRAVPRSGRTAA